MRRRNQSTYLRYTRFRRFIKKNGLENSQEVIAKIFSNHLFQVREVVIEKNREALIKRYRREASPSNGIIVIKQ